MIKTLFSIKQDNLSKFNKDKVIIMTKITNKSILVKSHIMKIKIINERTEKDNKLKN